MTNPQGYVEGLLAPHFKYSMVCQNKISELNILRLLIFYTQFSFINILYKWKPCKYYYSLERHD